MKINRWLFIALLLVAVLVGAGGMLVSVAGNRYTSTDAFCTSCHTMTLQASDPYFQKSVHRSNAAGIRPSCGECHIPTTNWFIETYTHVSSGIRDMYVTLTRDFSNPQTWETRRAALEQEVLADLRASNSVTCRSCHDAAAIQPKSEAGRQSHAALAQGGVTCVDCHVNLVHPPAQHAAAPNASQTAAAK